MIKVCIRRPEITGLSTMFRARGEPGDYRWWLEKAARFGIAFQIHRRRVRSDPQGAPLGDTMLIISGREGETVPFWRDLREHLGRMYNNYRGLPVAQRITRYELSEEGISRAESVGSFSRPGGEAGSPSGEQEPPDSDGEESLPDVELLNPAQRAALLAAASAGDSSSVPPASGRPVELADPASSSASSAAETEEMRELTALATLAMQYLQDRGGLSGAAQKARAPEATEVQSRLGPARPYWGRSDPDDRAEPRSARSLVASGARTSAVPPPTLMLLPVRIARGPARRSCPGLSGRSSCKPRFDTGPPETLCRTI